MFYDIAPLYFLGQSRQLYMEPIGAIMPQSSEKVSESSTRLGQLHENPDKKIRRYVSSDYMF